MGAFRRDFEVQDTTGAMTRMRLFAPGSVVPQFTCRFCDATSDSYFRTLCHELDVHVREGDGIFCDGCRGPLKDYLSHYRTFHGGIAAGEAVGAPVTSSAYLFGQPDDEPASPAPLPLPVACQHQDLPSGWSVSVAPSECAPEEPSFVDTAPRPASPAAGVVVEAGRLTHVKLGLEPGDHDEPADPDATGAWDIEILPDLDVPDRSSCDVVPETCAVVIPTEPAPSEKRSYQFAPAVASDPDVVDHLPEVDVASPARPASPAPRSSVGKEDFLDIAKWQGEYEYAMTRVFRRSKLALQKADFLTSDMAEESAKIDTRVKRRRLKCGAHGKGICKTFVDVIPPQPSDGDFSALAVKFVTQGLGNIALTEPLNHGKRKKEKKEASVCPHCGLSFATSSAVLRHLQFVHKDESAKIFRCAPCRKGYTRRAALITHAIWRPRNKEFHCRTFASCSARFATAKERLRHHRECHEPRRCDRCGEEFVHSYQLRAHLLNTHGNVDEELPCRVCRDPRVRFNNLWLREMHERDCRFGINKVVRADTPRCEQPKLLKEVVEVEPAPKTAKIKPPTTPKVVASRDPQPAYGIGKHLCKVCRLKHMSLAAADDHAAKCHVPNLGSGGGLLHICFLCPTVLKTLKAFKEHLNVHKEIAAFGCPHCCKRFRTRAGRNDHVAVMHKGRRFKCKLCKAVFIKEWSLRDHMAQHRGKAQYRCNHCGQAFFLYPNFYDHIKKYPECRAVFETRKNFRRRAVRDGET